MGTEDEVGGTAWGCFGQKVPGVTGSEFTFWALPGRYDVVVRAADGDLRSEPIALWFDPPRDVDSATAFASGGVQTLALVHLEPIQPESLSRFEELTRNWPMSLHGRLTRILLHIVQSRKAPPGERSVDQSLIEEADKLEPGHPLRLFVLLDVAGTCRSASNADALRLLQRVRAETSDPWFLRKAQSLGATLDK